MRTFPSLTERLYNEKSAGFTSITLPLAAIRNLVAGRSNREIRIGSPDSETIAELRVIYAKNSLFALT